MNNSENKLIVISGCSGGGKSTLLVELNNKGYAVVPEVGRELVKEQLAVKGDITPWSNPKAFSEVLIAKSIEAYHQANMITNVMDQMIFFDRSFLEGISYYQSLNKNDSNKYNHFVEELRYYPTVFMAPPWQNIFIQDDERKHSFEDAVSEYKRLLIFYAQSGYHIVELPKVNINERLQFVISHILVL